MLASQFILVYNTDRRALEGHERFSDAAAAAAAYVRAEHAYGDRPELEVVMLSGESIESIETTHGSYFKEPFEFIKDLAPAGDGAARD
jgi:hypothetical protein